MSEKTFAERLRMRPREEIRREQEENVAEIKRRIRNSDETIVVLGRTVKCVDASAASGYRFTGSGLVFFAGKVIERIDWQQEKSND